MLDQQPKTNHQVRQHPQPAAGQESGRQLLAPGKPGLGIHSQALPASHFKCLGAQNTAVPGTGSPWGRASLEEGNARSPGQRGSAAQNAVALLVHRAGLEQQRNTKAKIIKRKRCGPHLFLSTLFKEALPPCPELKYLHQADHAFGVQPKNFPPSPRS
ncbi:uncharacterized protein LOC118526730 [Halichoerus grypus]